jgi:membrane-bound lytic murein transglycosylase MltF
MTRPDTAHAANSSELRTAGTCRTGESPEVAKQIAARLEVRQVKWRQAEFGALIAELEAGRIDVIAAGMFMTPERAQRVSFSVPSFHVRQGLWCPKAIRGSFISTKRRCSNRIYRWSTNP